MKNKNRERKPQVVAIILNWNGLSIKHEGKPILELCLRSLAKVNYENLKILVADAESSDSSVDFINESFPFINTIKVKNSGWAYGNNVAIRYSIKKFKGAKYFLLLNNDLIFKEKEWLDKLVRVAERDDRIGIVGCRLLYPDGSVQHGGTHLTLFGLPDNYKTNRKSGFVWSVIGACMLVKKEVFKTIGLFDEIYLPFLEEEVDFAERARKTGYKIFYVGNTKIVHLEGKSLYKSNAIKSEWSLLDRDFVFVRNNFIFLLRWHKWRLPLNFLFRLVVPFFSDFISTTLHRTPIKYHFSIVVPALKEALRMYKTYKIPKV